MAQPDAEVEHHDHAEVNRVDAEVHHHRQQDRRADQDRRRHVDQAPEHQQQNVDQKQDDVLVAGDRQEERGDLRRHLRERHHVADARGAGDQGHHHRRPCASVRCTSAGQVAPAVVAIDEHGDEERPHAGDGAGLDRGEDAAEDAAQNDDERDQAPRRVDRDLDGLRSGDSLSARMAVAIGDDQHTE